MPRLWFHNIGMGRRSTEVSSDSTGPQRTRVVGRFSAKTLASGFHQGSSLPSTKSGEVKTPKCWGWQVRLGLQFSSESVWASGRRRTCISAQAISCSCMEDLVPLPAFIGGDLLTPLLCHSGPSLSEYARYNCRPSNFSCRV